MRSFPLFRSVAVAACLAGALALAPVLATTEEIRAQDATATTADLTPASLEADGIFVVDSSDGYGIDTCVASGASCGQAIADAWCRVHDFDRAVSFGKVTNDATPIHARLRQQQSACTGTGCATGVAITCAK